MLDLWLHISTRQDETVADKIYDRIEEACNLLRHHPQAAARRPEIAEEARALVIERWLALYKLTENGVLIVRVIDASRDLENIEWSMD